MKKKRGTWKCPHKCNLEKLGRPCVHLEALLGPVLGQDARRTVYTDDIHTKARAPSAEDLLIQKWETEREEFIGVVQHDDEAELRRRLTEMGLNPRHADVVIDRAVNRKTYKEIAADRGYTRAQGARQAYEDSKRFLAKKGFKK